MAALDKLGAVDMPSVSSSALPACHYPRSRLLSVAGDDTDSFYLQATGLLSCALAPPQSGNMRGVERVTEAWYSGTGISSVRSVPEAQRYVDRGTGEPDLGLGTGSDWVLRG